MLKRYFVAVNRIISYTDCTNWAGMGDFYFIDYFNGKFQFDQCYGSWGWGWGVSNLQCGRILGGRNLVRVCNCNVVVAAIFDFMTVEDWGE